MANMILPGTYIEVRPEGLIAPGQVTVGNVGVIGTAAKGPLNTPVVLGSFADAKQNFYTYDAWKPENLSSIDPLNPPPLTLVRALEQAFNHGASTVFAVRVGSGSVAKAGYTVKSASGDCVQLAAKTEGTWGDDLSINMAGADDNALISNELHHGNDPAPLTLKHFPVVKSARNRALLHVDAANTTKSLQILYSGGLADDDPAAPVAGQVKINRTTGVMSFGDAVAAADTVTVTYLVDKSRAVKVTLHLGPASEVYTAVDGQSLIDEINDPDPNIGSSWVKGTPLANSSELPSLSSPLGSVANFKDGNNGEITADYQTGLDAILNEEVHIVVAAGQDDSFGAKLDQHCQNASTDSIKHDRIGVIGSKLGAKLDDLRGHNLDSDRLIFVAPGIQSTDAASGKEVTLPGAYAAAAVAGMLAALPAHVSLTNKAVSVDGLEQVFTNAQLEQLVTDRVLALERHLGFRVVKGITTTTGSAFSQITTRRIVDFAKFVVRSAADPFIGLLNNDRVRTALRASVDSGLKQMVKDEMLITYDLSVSATRDEQIRGIARVDITLQPTFSIDFIKVTMFLQ
ncbi:MAG TPA: phage tail sheath subtilisin-like domain-containing protein [Candidatus Angelobacter sp.]|jgi:hypothetical protein|nr:phage tail sheath subtilisin-like domain-containing protein [Candidatus Angelobacter sp.]